jgi:hypothetical protein
LEIWKRLSAFALTNGYLPSDFYQALVELYASQDHRLEFDEAKEQEQAKEEFNEIMFDKGLAVVGLEGTTLAIALTLLEFAVENEQVVEMKELVEKLQARDTAFAAASPSSHTPHINADNKEPLPQLMTTNIEIVVSASAASKGDSFSAEKGMLENSHDSKSDAQRDPSLARSRSLSVDKEPGINSGMDDAEISLSEKHNFNEETKSAVNELNLSSRNFARSLSDNPEARTSAERAKPLRSSTSRASSLASESAHPRTGRPTNSTSKSISRQSSRTLQATVKNGKTQAKKGILLAAFGKKEYAYKFHHLYQARGSSSRYPVIEII